MAEIKCFLSTNVVNGAGAGDLNWLKTWKRIRIFKTNLTDKFFKLII